jgi:hypothetical protein
VLGYGAQQLIKHISGFGDYKVSHNSLMNGLYDPPELANLKSRCTLVRHREYIQDVVASSNFTNSVFDINPGLVSSFPWLSQVAQAFEEYYITGMIFEFKTLSADYTTASSAALGYVIMATQYNSLNPAFADKVTMENYEFANSAKPSQSFIHPIECKKSVNPVSELYIRTGSVPSNGDQRLYDLGAFQIATGGNSGTGVIGELWVTFEVMLCKPKLVSAEGLNIQTDAYQLPYANISNTNLFGIVGSNNLVPNVPGSNIGTFVPISNGNWLEFPASIETGDFVITIVIVGTSASLTAPTGPTLVNCTLLDIFENGTEAVFTNTGTAAGTFIYSIAVRINTTGSNTGAILKFTLSGMALPTSPTSGDLIVQKINYNIAV